MGLFGEALDELNVLLGGVGAPEKPLSKRERLAKQKAGERRRNAAIALETQLHLERQLLSPTKSIERGRRSAEIINELVEESKRRQKTGR